MTESKSSAIEIQNSLIAQGFSLPRFGVDGDIVEGGETWGALEAFGASIGLSFLNDGMQPEEFDNVVAALLEGDRAGSEMIREVGQTSLVDIRHLHSQRHAHRARMWKDISCIVLHQTACLMSGRRSWSTLRAHIGVEPVERKFYYVNPLDRVCYHAQKFNASGVGVEISGSFCGLQGNEGTHWKPKEGYSKFVHGPHVFQEPQIETARAAVRWILEEVNRHGGEILYIFAHRQTSKNRIGDPGEEIWREVGEWAKATFALRSSPTLDADYKVGSGYALPDKWTGAPNGVSYR